MKYQSKDLAQFPDQIRFAVENYKSPGLSVKNFDNILLCGLGGSGIAGRIVKGFFANSIPVPTEVISDYTLPEYTGSRTLAIICSYSGNTEETLTMYDIARSRGAKIIAITTGGKIADLATKNGDIFYKALAGFQPRMALGYSLTYLYLLFSELQGNFESAATELSKAAEKLKDTDHYLHSAESLFRILEPEILSKIIVITDHFTNPVGLRFCQQIQENAKSEAFLHELPEANHNVIESYYGKLNSIFFMLNSHIHPRTELRFRFIKNLLNESGNMVIEMDIDHSSILSSLQSIFILDWVSLLIADHKELNSSSIKNINALKQFLSEN